MGKCHFRKEWLTKYDANGHLVGTWAKEYHTDNKLLCVACNKPICIEKGFTVINQHSQTAQHTKNYNIKSSNGQQKIVATNNSIQTVFTNNVQTTRAELIWCLKNVQSNYSANSCGGLKDVFSAMFPSGVPDDFSLSRVKLAYLVNFALAPYFQEMLLDDLHRGTGFYSILYDETTNNENAEELQIWIRYWSSKMNCVRSVHLDPKFIGHATGVIIAEKIMETLEQNNLSLHKWLMVGSDGPNVSKRIFKILNEKVIAIRGKPLLDVGTCNIHIVHNAFLKGINATESTIPEFIIAVFYFFAGHPTRIEDFRKIQNKFHLPNHRFIKHVETRWLTIEDAILRIIEQWVAMEEYFLKYVPKHESQLLKNHHCKIIKPFLVKPIAKAELQFLVYVTKLFTTFTGVFQKEEPLIHVMVDELQTLILSLLNKFCKPEYGANINFLTITDRDIDTATNWKDLNDIRIGEKTTSELKKTSEKGRLIFLNYCRKMYIACVRHLIHKTPINNSLLTYLTCLNPKNLIHSKQSNDYIVKLSQILPDDPVDQDTLFLEWEAFVDDQEVRKRVDNCARVDEFWYEVSTLNNIIGSQKYSTITKIAQQCLCISHGNADVERGFSASARILTKDKTQMAEITLHSRLVIQNALKLHNNNILNVVITDKLIKMAKYAYQKYNEYLNKERELRKIADEDEKRRQAEAKEEEELRKQMKEKNTEINKLESNLKALEEDYNMENAVAARLVESGNRNLANAIKKNDLTGAAMAQSMLKSAEEKLKMSVQKKTEITALKAKIDKRKSCVIAVLSNKKMKVR